MKTLSGITIGNLSLFFSTNAMLSYGFGISVLIIIKEENVVKKDRVILQN